jgi:adsorption protein B
MGNALQSWERHGWCGNRAVRYWFWRDRKGLLTSPLGLLTNIFFLAGLFTWIWSSLVHRPWLLEVRSRPVAFLCAATLVLQVLRLAVRMQCVRRIYGIGSAMMVPVRALHGNLINATAAVSAVIRFARARRAGRALPWLKTDHAYPDQHARRDQHRQLDEVLVSSGVLSKSRVEAAKAKLSGDAELGDLLVHTGDLSEPQLSDLLGLRDGVMSGYLDPSGLDAAVLRVLPPASTTGVPAIPFRVERGQLFVAAPRVLQTHELAALQRFTLLPISFQLVTWRNFEELQSLLC